MKNIKSSLRAMMVAAMPAMVFAAGVGMPTDANAVIQLGFILDSSGSIGSGNWTTIVTGLSNSIDTLIPTDSSYELSVVTFSAGASPIVNHVLIDSAATRSSVAA